MDIADQGNDTADLLLTVALKNVGKPLQLAGIGLCLNCGSEVDGERRWCDADCREDYEREARRRQALVTQAAATA